jgi:SAM-dependent methyltransferase
VERATVAGVGDEPNAEGPNAEQRRSWDGPSGELWAENAERFDAAVAAYREPLLAAIATAPGERVLDVGCGAGQLALDLAARGASVLAVDLSTRLLGVARERAGGAAGVEFVRADAQTHPFEPGAFDAVVSRTGVMFFDDPPAAFAGFARALRPGGRLVVMVWQPLAENEWMRTLAALLAPGRTPPAGGPFSLGDPELVRSVLTGAGFADVRCTAVAEPLWFGADVEDAEGFVTGLFSGVLGELAPDAREHALTALRADLAAHTAAGGVRYGSAAWFVTARRP